jgi:hypothetical protein
VAHHHAEGAEEPPTEPAAPHIFYPKVPSNVACIRALEEAIRDGAFDVSDARGVERRSLKAAIRSAGLNPLKKLCVINAEKNVAKTNVLVGQATIRMPRFTKDGSFRAFAAGAELIWTTQLGKL